MKKQRMEGAKVTTTLMDNIIMLQMRTKAVVSFKNRKINPLDQKKAVITKSLLPPLLKALKIMRNDSRKKRTSIFSHYFWTIQL